MKRNVTLCVAAAGLALGAPALAERPSIVDVRDFGPELGLLTPSASAPSARAGASTVVDGPIGLGAAFGALRRGEFGSRSSALRGVDPCDPSPPSNKLIEMYDDVESLPLFPASINNVFSNPVWVNHPVDDNTPNLWQSQVVAFAHVWNAEIGGNATRKVRLFTSEAQPPDLFFFGWRTNLTRVVTGPTTIQRLVLAPNAASPARAGHDAWNSSADALWTSEIVAATTGFIADRLLWGGTCNEEPNCSDTGLPFGPIEHYYYLGQGFGTGFFHVCEFIGAAPAGFNVGDPVPVIVQSWHRIVHELGADNMVRMYIDYHDGQGEFLIADYLQFLPHQLDSIRGNASFESQDASHYVDNVFAIGHELYVPIAPPLMCCAGQYADDVEWLIAGQLAGQNARWHVSHVSQVAVEDDGSNKYIAGFNAFGSNFHSEQFRTQVPPTHASAGAPWRFCVDARVTAANSTVRAIALRAAPSSEIGAQNTTARLFIGYNNPNDPVHVGYQPRLYTQINPDFEPLIPTEGDPFAPETYPQIGEDIADIGPFPSSGPFKEVCVEVEAGGAMAVTVDGVPYGVGLQTLRNLSSVVRVSFETRDNAFGAGAQFHVDNVLLECATLPLVTYPDLSFVYLDDIENYIRDVPIAAQDDDGDPNTPTRWDALFHVHVRDGASVGRGGKQIVELENIFRSAGSGFPGSAGFNSSIMTQASTQQPNAARGGGVGGSGGWVSGGSFMLTDGDTSRLWRTAMYGPVPGQFLIGASVTHSAATGTLWVQRPHPELINESFWFDTGRTLASLGIGFGEWFTLTMHRNVNGVFTYRVNGALLRTASGDVVFSNPLRSLDQMSNVVVHSGLDRLIFSSTNESSAPPGSTLYADDIRAWTLPCPGDANNDGVVDFADFSLVLANYGAAGLGTDAMGNIAPDADGDGVPDDNVVNFTDFTEVLNNYGAECD